MLPPYAELHCLSNFSFLRGASHPGGTGGARAGAGLCGARDHRRVFGGRRRARASRRQGRRATARHRQRGHAGRRPQARAARHRPRDLRRPRAADHARPAQRGQGSLHALPRRCRGLCGRPARAVGAAESSVGPNFPQAPSRDAGKSSPICTLVSARWVAAVFPGRAWIAVELFARAGDRGWRAQLATLADEAGLRPVAAGDVHMHVRARRALQDTLTAIRMRTPLAECGYALHPNGERHLRSRARLATIYPPELIAETVAIAQRCTFSLDELRYEYPGRNRTARRDARLASAQAGRLWQDWRSAMGNRVRRFLTTSAS